MNKKVIIGGGGTGGHIFPAISIANALREKDPGIQILFVGAQGRLEMEKVPEAGYRIIGLPVAGFQRRLNLKIFSFLVKLWKSMQMSKKIIKDFKPDIAVGVGGFASGPIMRAAIDVRIPVIIQEQNSYAGITNRMLAKSAAKICVAYEGMEKFFPSDRIVITGNPVRQDLINIKVSKNEGLKHFGLSDNKETILILGGSLGARTINNSVMNILERIPENVQVIWQTGKYYYEEAFEKYKNSEVKNVVVVDFIRRMDLAYEVADVIISRAGAGTISELAIIGKPIILVPSPNVAADHQTFNAKSLKNRNAAILIPDSEAETSLMEEALNLINDKKKRIELSENLKKLAIPDSASRIADEILSLVK
jgi:UDP-N-acetylglucosamine--N-acetylmuramyl-(pentapeptide) pyrophosphoryl-undecaprenol N-acetylglucosamine transferase